MPQTGRSKIRSGLKQALKGTREELTRAKDELGKQLDAALEQLDSMADKVASDEDVANVVSGARSLAHRAAQKVADLLKDKGDPSSKGKSTGS